MTLVDRKTRTRARRTRGGAHPRQQPPAGTPDLEGNGARGAVAASAGHPQAQARQATRSEPKPEPTGDNGVPPSGPQRLAPPVTTKAPIGPPGVAGTMGKPAPEREPPPFGLLVLVGAIFGLAVLKEFGRIGGPVVVRARSIPASFWIPGAVGTLGRIGARVLGR